MVRLANTTSNQDTVGLVNTITVKKEYMKAGTHKTWGGKRVNSGRKKKENCSYISFRVSITQKESIYRKFDKSIHQLFREWINNLLKT